MDGAERGPADQGAETLWAPQMGRPSLPQRGLVDTQEASARDRESRGVPDPARQRHMEGNLGEISPHCR